MPPPDSTVAIRLLGPLEVEVAGVPVVLQRRARGLLAVLALEAGRPVQPDHLLKLLWGECVKSAERAVLHTTVSRLRAALTLGGVQPRAAPLERRAGGYQLTIDRSCVDALRFNDLLERARREAAPRRRADLLREALRLWRGPAGADADLERVRHLLMPFEERRVRAIEECTEIDLELGQPAAVVPDLMDLVAADPRRETPRRLLMLALHRSGRRIEALEVFRDFAHRLASEFGLDPGAELQQLHQAILRDDAGPAMPSAGRSRRGAADGPSRIRVPRQLPPTLPAFVGREIILTEFRMLLATDRLATLPAVIACHGVAGVGKSTVVIRAAHEAAELFPHGQLYVDLHGSTPGLLPVEPIEVLGRLLRALGMPATQVPTTVDEATGALRSMLATRRVLIVADNAADAAQVRPLMPASSGSALLVTSRRMLAALDGVTHVAVDVMSRDEALALLGRLCGHERIAAEPAHAVALTELCDHLPLALKIVGARLASRPGWSLGALVEQLDDERRRLDELVIDDLAVRISLRATYSGVKRASPTAARLFRLMSVVMVPVITPQIAEDLLGAPGVDARAALASLAHSHLIEPSTSDRYRVHDLLRLFAAERALAEDSPDERDGAIHRVLDRYLSTLRTACDLVRAIPRREHHTDPENLAPVPLTERASATAWLESERVNLTALVAQAADRAGPHAPSFARFALSVERELNMFLNMGGYRRDMEVLGALASAAAERVGDMSAAAYSLAGLAFAQLTTGKRDEAQATATRSLAFARAASDPSEEANSLCVLAAIQYQQGDAELALTSLDQAWRLRRETGNLFGEGIALHNMAEVLVTLGQLGRAQQHLERCLAIRRSIPDRVGEVLTMASLGRLHLMTGDHAAAEKALGQALDGCRETGYREEEWRVLLSLSVVETRQANVERALARAEDALLVAIRLDNACGQMLSLKASARALHLLGRVPQAIAYSRRAEQILVDYNPPADKEIEALIAGP